MFYLYIYRKQGIFQGIKTFRGGVGTSSGQASAHATARDADGHNEAAGAAWQTPQPTGIYHIGQGRERCPYPDAYGPKQ